ncbi:MAG TPA: hypothetical protein VMZ51_06645 [Acidimicrobiales bacterium]|nr:hypothetical protein [Acidimicrobiales bacterium]
MAATTDAPSTPAFAASCENQGRNHHPAQRGEDRHGHRTRLTKLSVNQLTLDLEADDEEEDGYQAVVHPVLEIIGQGEPPEPHRQLGAPKSAVGRAPRGVGPGERDQSSDEQDDPAGSLRVEKVPDRPREAPARE